MSKLTHAFIQNSNNGHYIAAWRDDPNGLYPTTHQNAEAVTQMADNKLYIFFN